MCLLEFSVDNINISIAKIDKHSRCNLNLRKLDCFDSHSNIIAGLKQYSFFKILAYYYKRRSDRSSGARAGSFPRGSNFEGVRKKCFLIQIIRGSVRTLCSDPSGSGYPYRYSHFFRMGLKFL